MSMDATSLSETLLRLAKEVRGAEEGKGLLALSQAVQLCCQHILGTPKMIVDMLEVHQQHLKQGRGSAARTSTVVQKRTAPAVPAAPSVPTVPTVPPAPTAANAAAIMHRIKNQISLCEDFLAVPVS